MTLKEVDKFSVGSKPQHVVPSWDLKTLWVANNGTGKNGSLTPIDPMTGKPGPQIFVDDPYNVYFMPDGSAAIIVDEHNEAVTVPQAALITFAGLEKVVVAREGKAAEKTVATGRRDGDWVEILSGLNSGELVVLKPAGLRTGQALIVTHLPSHSVTVVTNRLP